MIERQHAQRWSRGETTIQTIYLYPGIPGWVETYYTIMAPFKGIRPEYSRPNWRIRREAHYLAIGGVGGTGLYWNL